MDADRPIFRQVAALVEQSIVDGSLAEDAQAPSTNELAAFHRINPATAAKGLHQLLADGILTKRRGIGMFVVPGAREKVIQRRRDEFVADYLRPLVAEAETLGIDRTQLHRMLDDVGGAA
ncbi:GntR family transcriptional regulator [Jannaschia sp. R86511]|uniref:GntR family transcriptional regulator n=1 Tax=Jannaschia sp. R86511 TaxID=3093853 RepID=UPI0036D2EA4A